MLPVPINLVLISATPGVVVFNFTGAAGIDHYDVYRSQDPSSLGIQINVTGIAEPISPYLAQFSDDGISSIAAPVGPATYYYRVVAVDISGNFSLPSSALIVPIGVNELPVVAPKTTYLANVSTQGAGQVVTWAVPDNYNMPVNGWPDITNWLVQSSNSKTGPFTTIATLDATTDGEAKSQNNLWIDQFEDFSGTVNTWYQIAAKNSTGQVATFSVPGQGGYLSTFHAIMDRVRYDLGDDNPLFYQLDSIPQFKWTQTQLAKFVTGALDDVNGASPMATNFVWSNLPQSIFPVMEDWVIYRALRSRAIKEIANYLKYDDGVSFDMTNRPGDYEKLMTRMYDAVVERTERWKFTHRPEAIGLGSQRLPFRVTRPLSMLPNMKNVFGF